jgi:hypothetical protein
LGHAEPLHHAARIFADLEFLEFAELYFGELFGDQPFDIFLDASSQCVMKAQEAARG